MRSAAPLRRLSVLLLAFGLTAAVPRAGARQASPPAATAPLETVRVRPNVHVIVGAGGNVTVHVGTEGVILVDSGSEEMASRTLAAVRAITTAPIRLIINTSADADHVGGNAALAETGINVNPNAFNAGTEAAGVLAHENVLNRMSAPTGQQSPFPVAMWPTETYTGRMKSIYLNGDGIQVMRQPAAHSDGDSIVFFRRVDVIATGDVIDLRRFPVIDAARGGSVQGEIDALNRLIELAIPAMPLITRPERTHLVPGHGRIADHAELVEYRDMVTIVRDVVQSLVDQGRTREQVQAANPTQGFRARYGAETGPWTTGMFVDAIYTDLTTRARDN